MKKLSLLAGAVCALVLMGCSHSAGGGKDEPKRSVNTNDLTIGGVKIPNSGIITIPGGTVTGNPDYSFGDSYKGVFSVSERNLTISAFQIGQYEVTQRLYKAVMNGDTEAEAEPSNCQDKNTGYVYSDANAAEKDLRPVDGVTWFDAVYFCNRLSVKTGKVPYYTITDITRDEDTKEITSANVTENDEEGAEYGYRLPTEAEWEYAARGGDSSGTGWGNFFAGKASRNKLSVNPDLDSVGWYKYNSETGQSVYGTSGPTFGNTGYGSHRVGLKAPVSESLKLYDMSGNVWEWCWDWYTETIEKETTLSGPSTGTERVSRGGSWFNYADGSSVAFRSHDFPSNGRPNLGFRVVCSAEN